jgi:hypothetical protein
LLWLEESVISLEVKLALFPLPLLSLAEPAQNLLAIFNHEFIFNR